MANIHHLDANPHAMAKQLLECVPNFSEGRDSEKIAAIADAAWSCVEKMLHELHLTVAPR